MLTGIGFDNQNMVQWGGVKWDLITENRLSDKKFLEGHGYKVYSQNDEDGIIQEIFRRIGITNKVFIEIGVQDGIECNTHYLLLLGWQGVWIEASEACVDEIKRKFSYVINNGILKVRNEFVMRENINNLLIEAELPEDIDLLSIDIDGNDYYVFEAVDSVKPRVILIEYNAKFPPECSWKMPYCKDYIWNGTDRHGASLKALEELADSKGYVLVGTNINGVNAFFVRADLAQGLFPLPHTAENLYNPLRLFLTFKSGHKGDTCLINPTLQMEYLFNGTNDNYVTVNGFHPKEIHEGYKTYHQWMSQRKATAFLKVGEKQGEYLKIQVRYSSINFEQYGIEKPMFHVRVEEYGHRDIYDLEEYGLIIIICLNMPLMPGQIVKVEFEISNLWSPARALGTDDKRELGIAIHGIEAVNNNNEEINFPEQFEDLKIMLPISKLNARNIHVSVIEPLETLLEKNERYSIKVLLTNNSTIELASTGDNPLLISYHWIDSNGNIVVNDGLRSNLPAPILPSADAVIEAKVQTPLQCGEYILRLTLVQELIQWFDEPDIGQKIDFPINIVEAKAWWSDDENEKDSIVYGNIDFINKEKYRKYFQYENICKPLRLQVETCNICCLKCIICPSSILTVKREVMDEQLFEKIISDYCDIGGGEVSLTPAIGEVFLDNQLLKRIHYLNKKSLCEI